MNNLTNYLLGHEIEKPSSGRTITWYFQRAAAAASSIGEEMIDRVSISIKWRFYEGIGSLIYYNLF